MSFGGKKSSPAPVEKKPIVTENNDGVPDDAARRGVPIRGEAPAGTKPLLGPGEEKNKQGMLY